MENKKRPCDFLKESVYYDLGDCCDYGSSDCPITMKQPDIECRMTEPELRDITSWKFKTPQPSFNSRDMV